MIGQARAAGRLWCLHGALGEAADWRGLAARLSGRGWSTRAVDLWRFLACRPMGLAEFGRALNGEARAEPAGPRVLLGYSMGGRLALHGLLGEDRGPWSAAVIVSAHPGIEDAGERTRRRAADAGWAAKVLGGDWNATLDEWHGQAVLKGGEPPDRGGLRGRRQAVARGFVDWSLGVQEPLWERLGTIRVPVLWVVGEGDGKFRSLGERAVGCLADGELCRLPGAGHRVPWQAPEAFSERIAEFLERRVG